MRLTADYEITGCGATGPEGYSCTRHENGLHVARGLTLDSWAEEWPILEFDSVIRARLADHLHVYRTAQAALTDEITEEERANFDPWELADQERDEPDGR